MGWGRDKQCKTETQWTVIHLFYEILWFLCTASGEKLQAKAFFS